MRTKKYGFDEVQDIIATRIIVDDIPTAYTVLGIIHSNWRSIPQNLKIIYLSLNQMDIDQFKQEYFLKNK